MNHANLQHEGAFSFGDSKKCRGLLIQLSGTSCQVKPFPGRANTTETRKQANQNGRTALYEAESDVPSDHSQSSRSRRLGWAPTIQIFQL